MRAGALKHRLEILEPTYSKDRMGAQVVEYTTTRTVRAERVTASGNRSEEAGGHFPIRYSLTSAMRTRYRKTGE